MSNLRNGLLEGASWNVDRARAYAQEVAHEEVHPFWGSKTEEYAPCFEERSNFIERELPPPTQGEEELFIWQKSREMGEEEAEILLNMSLVSHCSPKFYNQMWTAPWLPAQEIRASGHYSQYRAVIMEHIPGIPLSRVVFNIQPCGPSLDATTTFYPPQTALSLQEILELRAPMLTVMNVIASCGAQHTDCRPENFIVKRDEVTAKLSIIMVDLSSLYFFTEADIDAGHYCQDAEFSAMVFLADHFFDPPKFLSERKALLNCESLLTGRLRSFPGSQRDTFCWQFLMRDLVSFSTSKEEIAMLPYTMEVARAAKVIMKSEMEKEPTQGWPTRAIFRICTLIEDTRPTVACRTINDVVDHATEKGLFQQVDNSLTVRLGRSTTIFDQQTWRSLFTSVPPLEFREMIRTRLPRVLDIDLAHHAEFSTSHTQLATPPPSPEFEK